MIQLLILADDLTGALDTGVQLSEAGVQALVVRHPAALPCRREGPEVLVMDTETRHLPPGQAYHRVAQLVRQAVSQGIPHLYKKTDSALRGNIGAELAALLEASGETQLPFLPAFPQMGRITRRGTHFIDGVPVSESVFGADPFEPVRCSNVAQLIGKQTQLPVCSASPGQWGEPSEKSILVYDAESVQDLERTAQALAQVGKTRILAGCAGFGRLLPQLLKLSAHRPAPPPPPCGRLLVVCGSLNPITLEQLDLAQRAGFARLRLTPEQQIPGFWPTPRGKEALEGFRTLFQANPRLILQSGSLDAAPISHGPPGQERLNVSRSLGCVVRELARCPGLDAMLITGGDTLLSCMDALGVRELEPRWELSPGVVLSQVSYGGRLRQLITKSGGFGPPDLLIQLTVPPPHLKTDEQEESIC